MTFSVFIDRGPNPSQDAMEVDTQWVTKKTSHFSYRSTDF